jgi:hypothetical protein
LLLEARAELEDIASIIVAFHQRMQMVWHGAPRRQDEKVCRSNIAQALHNPLGGFRPRKDWSAVVAAKCEEASFAAPIRVAREPNRFPFKFHATILLPLS